MMLLTVIHHWQQGGGGSERTAHWQVLWISDIRNQPCEHNTCDRSHRTSSFNTPVLHGWPSGKSNDRSLDVSVILHSWIIWREMWTALTSQYKTVSHYKRSYQTLKAWLMSIPLRQPHLSLEHLTRSVSDRKITQCPEIAYQRGHAWECDSRTSFLLFF